MKKKSKKADLDAKDFIASNENKDVALAATELLQVKLFQQEEKNLLLSINDSNLWMGNNNLLIENFYLRIANLKSENVIKKNEIKNFKKQVERKKEEQKTLMTCISISNGLELGTWGFDPDSGIITIIEEK